MKLVKSLLLFGSLPGFPCSSNFPHPQASSVETLIGHSSMFYSTPSLTTLIHFDISLLWCWYHSYSHLQAAVSPLGVGSWFTRLWACWEASCPCVLLDGFMLETSPGTAVLPGANVPRATLCQSTRHPSLCYACGWLCLLITGRSKKGVILSLMHLPCWKQCGEVEAVFCLSQ